MTFYSAIQYLKYSIRAKGRHGIHSPFVYAFIEQVLRRKPLPPLLITDTSVLEGHCNTLQKGIIEKIARYIGARKITTSVEGIANNECLLITATPEHWLSQLAGIEDEIAPYAAVIVPNIHHTPAHTAAWQQIKSRNSVRLSIDLFDIGLLLFRKEFKEKQDFTLR